MFIKLKKTNIYINRAYWKHYIFVFLRLFRSVFRSNSAISSIFLNSAHMPKQLDYRVAALKQQVANAYWGNQCSSMEYCLKLPNMVRTFWL